MSVDLSKYSLAQWCPEREEHRCGYCKNPSGSVSFGMFTEQLTVQDYKNLIDRGWRRSGKYCYKPIMDKTCCPQYTIRCDATEFTLSKSHKKIIKKFNKFLSNGLLKKNISASTDGSDDAEFSSVPGYDKSTSITLNRPITAENTSLLDTKISNDSHTLFTAKVSDSNTERPFSQGEPLQIGDSTPKKSFKQGSGADPNRPPCKKAKLIRLEKKKCKQKEQNLIEPHTSNSSNANGGQKTLKEFLEEVPCDAKHKIKLELISPKSSQAQWERVRDVEFELFAKYQRTVHNDLPHSLTLGKFTRFLVSTPLEPEPFPKGVAGAGYGSFHQQYWLDDKLIAVGVIDILPGCISSVYFFYDPDYRDLTLGTYGSLREIQLVQDLQLNVPDLKYYYMGFYIHSCPKMRYKGRLNPSFLLCPETYSWLPIEKCVEKLDATKYCRLNDDTTDTDDNSASLNDADRIKVVRNSKLMTAKDFVRIFDENRDVFVNMVNLIGKETIHNIVFWF